MGLANQLDAFSFSSNHPFDMRSSAVLISKT
jgi:hypothetical protein